MQNRILHIHWATIGDQYSIDLLWGAQSHMNVFDIIYRVNFFACAVMMVTHKWTINLLKQNISINNKLSF